MPPPPPPAVAFLRERLIAPVILFVTAMLPWSVFLLAGCLAAWFFHRFLAEDLAGRHESRDDDPDQPDSCLTITWYRHYNSPQHAAALEYSNQNNHSVTDIQDSGSASDVREEDDLQSAVPAP